MAQDLAQLPVAIGDRRIARWFPFSRAELPRLGGMYGFIVLLHLFGWGLFLAYQDRFGPIYAAGGAAAYAFGLRHAFDADHISAVDDTTRYLMQRGKSPLGVGFFFSMGHSSIVIGLSLGVALAAEAVKNSLPALQRVGGTVGATVSGTFLILIGILDLIILRGIVDVWRKTKSGQYSRQELDELLGQRGFLNRILGSRWRRFISDSWQMYPLGLLFGLGFDTASQIALIGLTAAAATGVGGGGTLPFGAVIALPLLFAGAMTLMDTSNGVMMTRAYTWAFTNPLRKVYYNMATVGLGVFVALGIGMIEYLQVISDNARFKGRFWDFIGGLDFQIIGYGIVLTFAVVWVGSMVLYKVRRLEERYGNVAVDPFNAEPRPPAPPA